MTTNNNSNNRKSISDMSPPAPMFSYAQAAKGMAAGFAASSQPSRGPSGSITPANDGASSLSQVLSELAPGAKWADDVDLISLKSSMDVAVSQASEGTIMPTTAKSPTTAASVHQISGQSGPGSPDFGMSSVSTLPGEEDRSSAPVPSSESTWESKSQSSAPDKEVTEPVSDKDKEKGRRKKDRAPPQPKLVLQEAPLPAVNIWKQRAAEQQKAKGTSSSSNPSVKAAATLDSSASALSTSSQPSVSEANSRIEPDAKAPGSSRGEDKVSRSQPGRSADDTNPRARRASHSRDKADRAAMSAPLPSLGDSESWPTPVIAQDEEQKRSQGKTEKGQDKDRANGTPGASKAKTNWVTVPITPSVVFNTPLPNTNPRRGGRGGGRGGREGGRGGSSGRAPRDGERSDTALPALPNGETSSRRGRPQEAGQTRSPSRSKRGSSNETQTRRESKMPAIPKEMALEEEPSSTGAPLEGMPPAEGAAAMQEPNGSTPFTARYSIRSKQGRRQDAPVASIEERQEHEAGSAVAGAEDESHIRRPSAVGVPQSDEPEDKKRGSLDAPTATRNQAAERRNGPYNTYPNRERPERGRGGIRRNGGHGFHPGSGHQYANGFAGPHVSQSQRYSRGGASRAQSIPSDQYYGRFANGYSAAQALPPIQTGYVGTGMYADYNQMYPMSAVPYNVHIDPLTVTSMVSTQLEYYFSMENLIKDVFLRKHMDSEGFVPLSFVANFNRLKQLCTDIELIKYVSQQSPNIEYRLGADGKDRIRKREGWDRFVLPIADRDSSAQNDGPGEYVYPLPSLPHVDTSLPFRHSSLPPLPTSPMSAPSGFQSLNDIPSFGPGYSGRDHVAIDGLGLQSTSPTSISNPGDIFTPLSQSQSGSPSNGDTAPRNLPNVVDQEPDVFPDSETTSLSVVWRAAELGTSDNDQHLPQPSRTFSNGSLDGQNIAGELTSSINPRNSMPNGHPPAQLNELQLQVSAEPKDPLAVTTDDAHGSRVNSAPRGAEGEEKHNMYWVKGKESPAHELPQGTYSDLYVNLRSRALHERLMAAPGTCPEDMVVLYQFWSHFLVRNFNTNMYDDFRRLAFEDKEQGNDTGISNLIKFYEACFYSSKLPMRGRVARHFVQLASGGNSYGPAFDSLRKAWRDGAVPFRNRSIILRFFDDELKAALE